MNLPDFRKLLEGKFDFESAAEEVWQYQLKSNPVMASFSEKLGLRERFFCPVGFFRDYSFTSGMDWQPELIFRSSGTTGQIPSVHKVRYSEIYEASALKGFQRFFGNKNYSIFALLPGYLERTDASLVHMAKNWMKEFGNAASGFYLSEFSQMREKISVEIQAGNSILLIGVAHALLDFAESFPIQLPADSIVMETGGMKGKRKELVRQELHERIKKTLRIDKVASEYGMTELLSQAYSHQDGKFYCPPWMRVVITDLHHPFLENPVGESGRINLIDLMNLHSCAFLRTDDLGKMSEDGSFEVLGRIDNSELRGCSLMY